MSLESVSECPELVPNSQLTTSPEPLSLSQVSGDEAKLRFGASSFFEAMTTPTSMSIAEAFKLEAKYFNSGSILTPIGTKWRILDETAATCASYGGCPAVKSRGEND